MKRVVALVLLFAVVLLAARWVIAVKPFGDDGDVVISTAGTTPKLGVYRGDAPRGPGNVDAYGDWLGRKVDIAEAFEPGETWDDVAGRSWQLGAWSAWVNAEPGRRLVLTVPLLPGPWDGRGPSSGPGAGEPVSLERGAAGQYDDYFAELARKLVSYRLGTTIVRLGHEFNGGWYTWRAAGKEAAFATYWRRIVTAMRSVPGHDLSFDWNSSLGNLGMQPDQAWPGDTYVDIVSVDVYDQSWAADTYPIPAGASTEETRRRQGIVWSQILDGSYGLRYWQRFAEAHQGPLAISEWGLVERTDGRGGGDNPDFITNMWSFINDPANRVAYHVYFDVMARDGGHQLSPDAGFTSPFSASAATFRRLFSGSAQVSTVTTPPPPATQLSPDIRPRLSSRTNRASPRLLANRRLPARAFIFIPSRASVRRVAFYIDDPRRRHRPFRLDTAAPFDLAGGTARKASAFGVRLRPGRHTLTVAVRLTNGRLKVAHATFLGARR
jgi:glycosyl hydrolase family 26